MEIISGCCSWWTAAAFPPPPTAADCPCRALAAGAAVGGADTRRDLLLEENCLLGDRGEDTGLQKLLHIRILVPKVVKTQILPFVGLKILGRFINDEK